MSITGASGQFPGANSAPRYSGLADLESAQVGFGYYQENVVEGQAAVEHNSVERRGPIGWWNRRRLLTAGVSVAVAANLAFLPMVQSAVLIALEHVL